MGMLFQDTRMEVVQEVAGGCSLFWSMSQHASMTSEIYQGHFHAVSLIQHNDKASIDLAELA